MVELNILFLINRYFVLTRDYLHCFKRASGSVTERISDMGQFIFKVSMEPLLNEYFSRIVFAKYSIYIYIITAIECIDFDLVDTHAHSVFVSSISANSKMRRDSCETESLLSVCRYAPRIDRHVCSHNAHSSIAPSCHTYFIYRLEHHK